VTIPRLLRTAGAAALAAALAVGAAATEAPAVSVVGRDGGAYSVSGSFSAAIPREVAWAVLTDYDNLSSFVSSMRSSSATRDRAGQLLVTQHAVGRAGPFTRALQVVLEVTEEAPVQITFRDVCGASFHSYAGHWTIAQDAGGVHVAYELDARPRSSPPLFGRSILASNARGLLAQVRTEMLRRARVAEADRAYDMTLPPR
jgi:carbon monoxide dehydrogenase subunit G